ncbi:hypothetical protein RCH10_005062 [Variovorax sp. GrIS 2.14]|uniref:hypothetical protein n=1 Tax=Variovorax sp. GrIS 2.14 TaxID=3071709 RepID=UPI0038F7ED65
MNLNFVSLDDNIHAICSGPTTEPLAQAHAAIYTDRDMTKADTAVRKTLGWQHWDGRFVQYAGAGESTHREKMATGFCRVYVFAGADERDAFCRWTKAIRAHFVRTNIQI